MNPRYKQLRDLTMNINRNTHREGEKSSGKENQNKNKNSQILKRNVCNQGKQNDQKSNLHLLHYSPKASKLLLEDSNVTSRLSESCTLQDKYDELWTENVILLKKIDTLISNGNTSAQSIRALTSSFLEQLNSFGDISPALERILEFYMLAMLNLADMLGNGRMEAQAKNAKTKEKERNKSIKFGKSKRSNKHYFNYEEESDDLSESSGKQEVPSLINNGDLPILIEEEDSHVSTVFPAIHTIQEEKESQSPTIRSHSLPYSNSQDSCESEIEVQEEPSSIIYVSQFGADRKNTRMLGLTSGIMHNPNNSNSISQYYIESESEEQSGRLSAIEGVKIPNSYLKDFSHQNRAGSGSSHENSQSEVLSRRKIFNPCLRP